MQPSSPEPRLKLATSASSRAGSAAAARRRPLAAHIAATLAALAATGIAALSLAVAPALADDCPNAALRAHNNSIALPDCRAYELVSNPFKEGFVASLFAFTDDGDRFAYKSLGNFADNGLGSTLDNNYIAERSGAGWVTTAISPSGPAYTKDELPAQAFSPDLRTSLWFMARPDQSIEVNDFYLRSPDGAFTRIGPGANPATLAPAGPGGTPTGGPTVTVNGVSDDMSHVAFNVQGANVYPGDIGASVSNLYEYVGTGNDRPRLVGVDNNGHQISSCDTAAGDKDRGAYNTMSRDGRVIFYTASCSAGLQTTWARVNATITYAVSASRCTRTATDPGGACNPPASSRYEGAAPDGSRVFFTTAQQLVNEDTDQTTDLYACDIPPGTPTPTGATNACSALHEVSGAATDANVLGVTRLSGDGSRIYFVATGVLAANRGANDHAAVTGDDNLYVWHTDAAHPDGHTTFVGKLDPSDVGLWGDDSHGRAAQTTDDGRYLVLSTQAPLIDSGPQMDTDTAADVYRYDAATGALVRVSTDADGEGGNGLGLNAVIYAPQFGRAIPTDRPRASMTADGSSVVFETSEALSANDTNGTSDFYAWHAGHVSLISSGAPAIDATSAVAWISPSGRDIYFSTTSALTPNDTDTQQDIYDARVDGGFDFTRPAPCSGDRCQGGQSAAPAAVTPRSGASAGSGDAAEQATPTFSLAAVSASQRRRFATTGKLVLTVTANTPATLSAAATATIARKPRRVASARRTTTVPGAASLTLTLTKRARTQLAGDGKLTVKVVVSNSKVAMSRPVTLKLTHAKAKTKRKKGQS